MDAITIFLFICGFVLLVGGAEILVRGASQLAIMAKIPTLVIGLTIVAYGTSSPELAVTVRSTLTGNADLAIGNIVGSNIANILLILGISATIVPLFVSQQLVRLDVPLMIGISILLLILGLDGTIDRSDGFLLLFGALAYTAFTIYQARKDNQATVSDEVPQPFDLDQRRGRFVTIGASLGLVVIGLIMLVIGSQWMVNGAITVAKLFGVSELVIGLTIVAIGTSLPEIATSVAACLKGERDLAVGNAIGSNIFNILLVVGMCGAIAPNGVPVANSALRFDIPIMIAVAAACLPIFFTGFRILRQEGILFLAYYVAYTLYLFFKATEHDALDEFGAIMLVFVVPITFLTLIVLAIQAIRDGRRRKRTRESRE
ncbi:MAG TPA: calcium/sodium antiporter [Elainellaceae cyanobacterium]